MPRKTPDPDIDFNIFVDPSCLSAPMDEETPLPQISSPATRDITPDTEATTVEPAGAKECGEIRSWSDIHLGPSRGPSRPPSKMEGATVEDSIDDLLEKMQDDERNERHEESVDAAEELEAGFPEVDIAAVQTDENLKDNLGDESTSRGQEDTEDVSFQSEDHNSNVEESVDTIEDTVHYVEDDDISEHHDESSAHAEESLHEDDSINQQASEVEDDSSMVDEATEEAENDEMEQVAQQEERNYLLEQGDDTTSRRSSALSDADRRGSSRTEALIQAAARAVVAQIEERAIAAVQSHRDSLSSVQAGNDNLSPLNSSLHTDNGPIPSLLDTTTSHSPSRRESCTSSGSQIHHHQHHHSSDEGANDSSSHHESDADVFSDRGSASARSSLSFDGSCHHADEEPTKTNPLHSTPSRRRGDSPRLSGVSSISQYEREESPFTSTTTTTTTTRSRDTPRMPFRTPSDVRAIQLSSPTPSVFGGRASPRSAKRHGLGGGGGSSGLPSVSRLGSPTVSAQYSPKGRSTPPRFKMRRDTPPLVLLHVTLLPLRWAWAEVLDDGLPDGSASDKAGFGASDELKGLADAWRQLRDRVGDTVLERGILLPHPQNDYEVLEERLLEALELPLRRRARILECGHYLGPANEMAGGEPEEDDDDEEESEADDDGYDVQTGRFHKRAERRHWCGTCKGEIKYEALGPGRVFRVKVYASNGLMKAGAWAACWKEMERVDVEVEPIVGPALHRELEQLAAFQARQEEETRHRREAEEEEEDQTASRDEAMRLEEEEVHLPTPRIRVAYEDRDVLSTPPQTMHASPPSFLSSSPIVARSPSSFLQEPIDTPSARRRREEARLREIYGSSPPRGADFDEPAVSPRSVHIESPASSSVFPPESPSQSPMDDTAPPPPSYVPASAPRSPSEEAAERRTQRRTGAYQSASLPELAFEAVKVLMRDRKNVAIAVLGVFVVLLAMRPTAQRDVGGYTIGVPVVPVIGHEAVLGRSVHGLESVVHKGLEDAKVLTVSRTVGDSLEETVSAEASVPTEATSPEPTVAAVEPEVESVLMAHAQPEVGVTLVSEAASLESTSTSISAEESTVTEKKVVRVVETVTETVKVSVTATESVVATQEPKMVQLETEAQATAKAASADLPIRVAAPAKLELRVCPVKRADVCLAGGTRASIV